VCASVHVQTSHGSIAAALRLLSAKEEYSTLNTLTEDPMTNLKRPNTVKYYIS